MTPNIGLLERDGTGRVFSPFAEIRTEFTLKGEGQPIARRNRMHKRREPLPDNTTSRDNPGFFVPAYYGIADYALNATPPEK